MLTRTRSLVAAGLALAVLAGCGSEDGKADEKASSKPQQEESSEAPAYLPVPDGVTLTEPGTALGLGEPGTIAFERRQEQVGVLEVTVARIERTSFQASFPGWSVDDATAARTPHFVRLTVTNRGEVDLGGLRLDNVLWADDGTTLEAPQYYTAKQLALCNGGPLPASFATGATTELCQVYFIAPGRQFEGVAFSPYGGLDRITWSGDFSPVTKPSKKKAPKKGKNGGASGAATPGGS